MPEPVKIVGIGAGGHAKVIIEIIEQMAEYKMVGFTDADEKKVAGNFMGYPILGGDQELEKLYKAGVQNAFIGVGAVSSQGTRLRARLFRGALKLGFRMATLIHPRAFVSPSATIGAGSVVMAGAVVSAGVCLGENTAVYSGVVIEHESVISNHVLLSPGVMVAGGVAIEEGAFVGIGASIIQGVRVGVWTTVGAGAVVLRDIPDGCVAVGMPARVVEKGERRAKKASVKKIGGAR